MAVSEDAKRIARAARSAFGGGKPKVYAYWDDAHKHSVDILSVADQPDQGVTSYATLGLSQHSIGLSVGDRPLRVELLGACWTESEVFANILSTCAFNVINSGHRCAPGIIFPDVVSIYLPDSSMAHILFVSPFLWGDGIPETLDFSDRKVTWLQAVPISEAERAYAEENGADALESLFEQHQIDVYDLNRDSVLP